MFGVRSTHPALLALVAFLLRHIPSIEHNAIYIIYDNQSTFETEVIAKALYSRFIPYTTMHDTGQQLDSEEIRIFQKKALVISLVKEQGLMRMIDNKSMLGYSLKILSYRDTKFMCLISNASEIVTRREETRFNMFHVLLRNDGGLDFLVWPTYRKDRELVRLERLTNEAALVGSLEWLKFCNRVDRRSLKDIQVFTKLMNR